KTAGFELPDVQELRLSLAAFPAADQALRTRQIRPLAAAGLPDPLKPHLHGELVVIPLVAGERRLAIMVGQAAPNVALRSREWRERAEQIAQRAALLAELANLSAAYRDERRLRQASQTIIAAI